MKIPQGIGVETDPSGRALCQQCDKKIPKGSKRLWKYNHTADAKFTCEKCAVRILKLLLKQFIS